MTRKHFNLLAESLGKDMAKSAHKFEDVHVEIHYHATLNALATTNPNFDHGRFVAAVIKSAQAAA